MDDILGYDLALDIAHVCSCCAFHWWLDALYAYQHIGSFKCGLYWQGLTHDLSKYSPIEFWNGVKYYTGTASPHVGERKDKGYSEAWIHHHNGNKHHAEYWTDINPDGEHCACDMPIKYLQEMICDRVAACMIYLGDKYTNESALNYYNSHIDENQFSDNTRQMLETALTRIA